MKIFLLIEIETSFQVYVLRQKHIQKVKMLNFRKDDYIALTKVHKIVFCKPVTNS